MASNFQQFFGGGGLTGKHKTTNSLNLGGLPKGEITKVKRTLSGANLSVSSCEKFKFFNGGTKLVTLQGTATILRSYTLTVPYDVSSATEDYNHLIGRVSSSFTNALLDFDILEDNKTVILLNTNDRLASVLLDEEWNFANYTLISETALTSNTADTISAKPDGTKIFVGSQTALREYDLVTPGSVSSRSLVNTVSLGFTANNDDDQLILARNGVDFYRVDRSATSPTQFSKVVHFQNTTPWTLTGFSQTEELILANAGPIQLTQGLDVSHDGSKLISHLHSSFFSLNLTTPYNLSGATYGGGRLLLDLSSIQSAERGIGYSSDGTKLFISDSSTNADIIASYNLSTPYSPQTATPDKVAALPFSELDPVDVSPTADVRNLFVCEGGTKLVVYFGGIYKVYSMTTPNDLDTLTDDQSPRVYSISSIIGINPTTIFFSEDATKFAYEHINDLFVFSLSTPLDINTRSTIGTNTSLPDFDHFSFNQTGSRFVIADTVNDDLKLYSANAYDPSSASQLDTINIGSGVTPYGQNTGSLVFAGGVLTGAGGALNGLSVFAQNCTSSVIEGYEGDMYSIRSRAQQSSDRYNSIAFNLANSLLFSKEGRYIHQFSLTRPGDLSSLAYDNRCNKTTTNSSSDTSGTEGYGFEYNRNFEFRNPNSGTFTGFIISSGSTLYSYTDTLNGSGNPAEIRFRLNGRFSSVNNHSYSGFTSYSIFNISNVIDGSTDKNLYNSTQPQVLLGNHNSSSIADGPDNSGTCSVFIPDGGTMQQCYASSNSVFFAVPTDTYYNAPELPFQLIGGYNTLNPVKIKPSAYISSTYPSFRFTNSGNLIVMSDNYLFEIDLITPYRIAEEQQLIELKGNLKIKGIAVTKSDVDPTRGDTSTKYFGFSYSVDGGETETLYRGYSLGSLNGNFNSLQSPVIIPVEIIAKNSFKLFSSNNAINATIIYEDLDND